MTKDVKAHISSNFDITIGSDETLIEKVFRIMAIISIIIFPVVLLFCFRVVRQYKRAVVLRFGRIRLDSPAGPGIIWVIPCTDEVQMIDLRTQSINLPPQEVLTKDSVTVTVDAVTYFHIEKPLDCLMNIQKSKYGTELITIATIRNILGGHSLHNLLTSRESISFNCKTAIDKTTSFWGVVIERVEIKDVLLPFELQKAMAAEAEGSRIGKAKVIESEGEIKAAENLKSASAIINENPQIMMLRYLQTLNHIAANNPTTVLFPFPIELPGTRSAEVGTQQGSSPGAETRHIQIDTKIAVIQEANKTKVVGPVLEAIKDSGNAVIQLAFGQGMRMMRYVIMMSSSKLKIPVSNSSSRTLLDQGQDPAERMSQSKFFYQGFNLNQSEDYKDTDKIIEKCLVILSIVLVVVTFPLSLFAIFVVVRQFERAVILRNGKLRSCAPYGPGLVQYLPCIDIVKFTDLRIICYAVPPQEALTKDAMTIAVDAVVYYRINDPIWAVVNIADYKIATQLLAATTLRNALGTRNLAEILVGRSEVSAQIFKNMKNMTLNWGVKIVEFDVKDISLPLQLQKAMATEAESSRLANARIIVAKAEIESTRNLQIATKLLMDNPFCMQLRYLQSLQMIAGDKTHTVILPFSTESLKKVFK